MTPTRNRDECCMSSLAKTRRQDRKYKAKKTTATDRNHISHFFRYCVAQGRHVNKHIKLNVHNFEVLKLKMFTHQTQQ